MTNVVLGVTGGIAAYKACDLISPLREAGFTVRCAMTRAATKFITPLTLGSLTGHPVLVDDLGADADPSIPHVAWARFADLVVVAPASADFLGRLSHGLADDALTSMLLALEPTKPVVLAPAMNTVMWENPFVQANIERIRQVGGTRFRFVEPVAKRLACGETGVGGLAEASAILDAVKRVAIQTSA